MGLALIVYVYPLLGFFPLIRYQYPKPGQAAPHESRAHGIGLQPLRGCREASRVHCRSRGGDAVRLESAEKTGLLRPTETGVGVMGCRLPGERAKYVGRPIVTLCCGHFHISHMAAHASFAQIQGTVQTQCSLDGDAVFAEALCTASPEWKTLHLRAKLQQVALQGCPK